MSSIELAQEILDESDLSDRENDKHNPTGMNSINEQRAKAKIRNKIKDRYNLVRYLLEQVADHNKLCDDPEFHNGVLKTLIDVLPSRPINRELLSIIGTREYHRSLANVICNSNTIVMYIRGIYVEFRNVNDFVNFAEKHNDEVCFQLLTTNAPQIITFVISLCDEGDISALKSVIKDYFSSTYDNYNVSTYEYTNKQDFKNMQLIGNETFVMIEGIFRTYEENQRDIYQLHALVASKLSKCIQVYHQYAQYFESNDIKMSYILKQLTPQMMNSKHPTLYNTCNGEVVNTVSVVNNNETKVKCNLPLKEWIYKNDPEGYSATEYYILYKSDYNSPIKKSKFKAKVEKTGYELKKKSTYKGKYVWVKQTTSDSESENNKSESEVECEYDRDTKQPKTIYSSDDSDYDKQDKIQQVYCIIPGKFHNKKRGNDSVIKIGKHNGNYIQRIQSYGQNTIILSVEAVKDCTKMEKSIKAAFQEKYDIFQGHEYFWCPKDEALVLFKSTITKSNQ